MTFKKRLLAMCMMVGFSAIALLVSVITIFANNNLLVKTSVKVTYKGLTLSDAYVATRSWQMGDEAKTTYLESVNAEEAPEASTINTELTEDSTYVVYEFELYNRSTTENYYFQTTYRDDCYANSSNSVDGNMVVSYCSSVGEPLEIDEILSAEVTTLTGYYWNEETRLSNNITAGPGQKVYSYAIVEVDDTNYEASFSGNFVCNVSLEKFSTASQKFGGIYYGPVNGHSTEPIYYIKMGEMPQSWAGTDDTQYTLTEETYTEFGVDYPIYVNGAGDRFAKKDGAYYKMEQIIWQVVGIYYAWQESKSSSSYYSGYAYDATRFNSKTKSSLVVISTKVLFYSQWNSTLARVNYPNSTIYAKLNEFYNDVLIDFDSKISNTGVYYNNVEEKAFVSLSDSISSGFYGSVSTKLWLFKANNSSMWSTYATNFSRLTFPTNWAVGSEKVDYAKWWLRTNQYNVVNDREIFKAMYVNKSGTHHGTGADITEVMGVRPAMCVTL